MRQTSFLFIDGKACRVCGTVKSEEDFHLAPQSRDGRSNRCKACQSDYFRQYSATHRNQIAEVQARWYDRNRERIIERQRAYYFDNREAAGDARRRWCDANPEKILADSVARRAIESGKIEKQPCGQCGNPKAEAHHDDYTKPLDVRWLCRRCHRRHHASLAS
jgi:hypothetical protein